MESSEGSRRSSSIWHMHTAAQVWRRFALAYPPKGTKALACCSLVVTSQAAQSREL